MNHSIKIHTIAQTIKHRINVSIVRQYQWPSASPIQTYNHFTDILNNPKMVSKDSIIGYWNYPWLKSLNSRVFLRIKINGCNNDSLSPAGDAHHTPSWMFALAALPRRTKRRPYTKLQIFELEKEFQAHQYLTRDRRARLSQSLSLSERQVRIKINLNNLFYSRS